MTVAARAHHSREHAVITADQDYRPTIGLHPIVINDDKVLLQRATPVANDPFSWKPSLSDSCETWDR
jgi:hypothetical protein